MSASSLHLWGVANHLPQKRNNGSRKNLFLQSKAFQMFKLQTVPKYNVLTEERVSESEDCAIYCHVSNVLVYIRSCI